MTNPGKVNFIYFPPPQSGEFPIFYIKFPGRNRNRLKIRYDHDPWIILESWTGNREYSFNNSHWAMPIEFKAGVKGLKLQMSSVFWRKSSWNDVTNLTGVDSLVDLYETSRSFMHRVLIPGLNFLLISWRTFPRLSWPGKWGESGGEMKSESKIWRGKGKEIETEKK